MGMIAAALDILAGVEVAIVLHVRIRQGLFFVRRSWWGIHDGIFPSRHDWFASYTDPGRLACRKGFGQMFSGKARTGTGLANLAPAVVTKSRTSTY
jgi:hypothetical protein